MTGRTALHHAFAPVNQPQADAEIFDISGKALSPIELIRRRQQAAQEAEAAPYYAALKANPEKLEKPRRQEQPGMMEMLAFIRNQGSKAPRI